jgi:biopolymer transport protein TolR
MQIAGRTSLESNINVTPLVDVCLVLLIIFMVVTPMIVSGNVMLPETAHSSPAGAEKQIEVTVKADGSVYVDTLVMRREEVPGALERLQREFPQRKVAVRGDKRVQYGDVADVLDACRAAGFEDVSLISLKKSEG